MGVSSTTNRIAYTGDGSSTSFSFPYYFFNKSDLLVLVYDTLLGGITTYVLNSGFTVTGTANSQGLYPSGASVVFSSYVPLATDIVVIIRDPSLVQNFSLVQNGLISSAALVQQLDYLTLLVQRLQDKVSRSVMIPDGLGSTFNTSLPTNTALKPNAFLQLNSSASGIALNDNANLPGWQSVTVSYSQLSTAATSNQVSLFSVPAGSMLTGLVVKHAQAFAGTSITDVYVQAGISGTYDKFIDYFDVYQAVADQSFKSSIVNYIGSWASATTVYLQAISVGANLSSLSQGSVTIFYQTQIV